MDEYFNLKISLVASDDHIINKLSMYSLIISV